MDEKKKFGEQKAPRPSKWSRLHPEAIRKGFEQGPAMIQFERSLWKCHGDWVSQQPEGRDPSSGFFSSFYFTLCKSCSSDHNDDQSEEAVGGSVDGLGVGKDRSRWYYWSSWK